MERLSLGAVVVVVAASGCGGGSMHKSSSTRSSTSSQAAGRMVVQTVTVTETEYKLTPSVIKLGKPGTYIFKGLNNGTISHALAISGAGVSQSASPVGPGQTTMLKVTLTQTGRYELYCPVDGHKNLGMRGTVTLGSGGAQGPPATAPTTTTPGGTTTGSSGYRGY